jgi:hypothetical protein
MEQSLRGPMDGEASHELGVRSADVSVLSGVLPQSSKSPASYQSPGSRRSEGLWLCSGHHLGSPHKIIFKH